MNGNSTRRTVMAGIVAMTLTTLSGAAAAAICHQD